jgi:hypothetical protein
MFSIGAIKKLSFFAEKNVDLFYVILKQRRFQMKRICFVLVSLLAITLLSCSALDNSAEDVNYPQDSALNKVVLSSASTSYAEYVLSSSSYTASQTMSVWTNVKGAVITSNTISFSAMGLPADAIITDVQFNTGTMKYTGAIVTDYLTIRKGNSTPPNEVRWYWGGAGGTTLPTDFSNPFGGQYAKDTYYVSFTATCISFSTATNCAKSYEKTKLIIKYRID